MRVPTAEEKRIKREYRLARKKSPAQVEREQNMKIWKHIFIDGFRTLGQLIGLLIIGTGITLALIAFIGITAWGLYSLAT